MALRMLKPRVASVDLRTGRRIEQHATREDAERARQVEKDKRRGSAWSRGYDRAWAALRDAVVIERGCRCELCGQLVVLRKTEATPRLPVAHVDHIQSIEERPDLRLDRSNLRCLCPGCHNARTAREQGFARH